MEDVKVITLDNKEYIIADEIIINNIKYVYLTNEQDFLDFSIRKIEVENNEEFIVKLDSDQEFDMAMQAFTNKHKQELDDFE